MSASSASPFIIPLFIPHQGCPHNCIFCDQKTITGITSASAGQIPASSSLERMVRKFASYNHQGRRPVQLSFYGGNFLGMAEDETIRLLTMAESFVTEGLIDGIRFSTRPDTITRRKLDLLMNYSVTTIELGIQSMADDVLQAAGRGHTAACCETALNMLQAYSFTVGAQMMIGLPKDTGEQSLATAARLASLSPDFVRIYPTIVISGSPLAGLYNKGAYKPLSLEQAVNLTASVYRIFKDSDIAVIRMGLQATEELARPENVLAGPYHPSFGHLVLSQLLYDQVVERLDTTGPVLPKELTINVHPRDLSIMRGLHNANIRRLKESFGFVKVNIITDDDLPRRQAHPLIPVIRTEAGSV